MGPAFQYKRAMHALPCTLGAFALILILARLKLPLAAAITTGTVVLGAMFALSVGEIARTLALGAIQLETISLVIVTMLLLAVSLLMQQCGQLTEIVTLVKALLRRPAVAMAALPAIIGLLPMPGGAIFSAPMVSAAAGDAKVRPSMLSAINYWFRHIWEHWWPLYPGVILATTFAQHGYFHFAAFQIPLGLIMVAAGLLLMARLHPDLHVQGERPAPGTWLRLVRATATIWLILAVWIPINLVLKYAITPYVDLGLPAGTMHVLERYAPLAIGLAVSFLWTADRATDPLHKTAKVFKGKSLYLMALLVLSVKVFGYMLAHVHAADGIRDDLAQLHIPPVLVMAALPFIAGMVTGLAVGFVGTSFPLVAALATAAAGTKGLAPPVMALAWGFGHLGQMVSPLHLCHVVSNQYFKTPFGPVYRQLAATFVITAVLIVAYVLLLNTVF